METRPVIHIEPTVLDRFIESLTILVLLTMWLLVIWNYDSLPDIIPSHFGAGGEVNDYSRKSFLFVLPGIVTAIFLGLRILAQYPDIYNYPKKVTASNAMELYRIGAELIRSINLGIAISTAYITWSIIDIAKGSSPSLGGWFIALFIVCIFGPVAYFLFRMIRVK